MRKQLSILAPVRYPWYFNGPKFSRHKIERRAFLPLNYISSAIEGVTVFNPLPPRRFDLVHAFNRVPLGVSPFIIGFESHLPRAFGLEQSRYFNGLAAILSSPRCRGIIAISEFARRVFLRQHDASPLLSALSKKLEVRYPNMIISDEGDPLSEQLANSADEPLRLCFVGNHFARKGGCVAVRLAELATRIGLDIHVDIVSTLEVGGKIWTDPTDSDFFKPYLALLDLPNVTLHKALPNKAVHELLRRAHFSLLPTFSDTFGYSVIEAMSNYVPVIATRQGALPELLVDGQSGILLHLPVDSMGEWIHISTGRRDAAAFMNTVRDEIERMAAAALSALVDIISRPGELAKMRQCCFQRASSRFGAAEASSYWDNVYERSVEAR